MKYIVAGVVIVFVFLGAVLVARSQETGKGGSVLQKPQSDDNAIPSKLRRLSDLQLLGSHLTQLERLEWILKWYIEERRVPSETRAGIGGGPIDSGYIQRQLIMSMAGNGEWRALRWLSNCSDIHDKELALAIKLALGVAGDEDQHDVLIEVLRCSSNPHFRWLAAMGLGRILAYDARDLLKRVVKEDTYRVVFVPTEQGSGDIYPVRDKAKAALRALEEPQWSEEKKRQFRDQMADLNAFVTQNLRILERIAALGRVDRDRAITR